MVENHALPEFEEKVRQAFDVPGADATFVNRLRADLLSRTVQPRPQWRLRLAWAIALALVILVLLISAPRIVSAVRQLFGYVPDIGLVDSSAGLRILAEPASVTRAGVTLTVTQAIVYSDHVQIVFETKGIAPQDDLSQGADNQGNPAAFCGGVNIGEAPNKDGDPTLQLPDGTVIERLFGSDEYPDNVFYTKPVYKTKVPANVTEMTLVLKCIYGSRRGAIPENWEVPLKLVAAPPGTVVGTPVFEVRTENAPAMATAASTKNSQEAGTVITVRLEKVVPQAEGYSFFFSLAAQPADEILIALYSASASLIDSTGQKIALIYQHPWHPGEPVDLWELQTTAKPGYGPYTLVIDKIFAYYNTNNAVFDFDPGPNPQMGQSRPLDQTFTFADHMVKVTSAKMEEKDFTTWELAADIPGFQFTFEAVDGKTPIRLGILDNDAEHSQIGQVIPSGDGEPSPAHRAGLYYEKGIPTGRIPVSIYEASSLISGDWQFQGKVVSARAVSFDPSQHPEVKDAQGYGHDYEFTVQSDDPDVPMNIALEIALGANGWVPTLKVDGKPGATSTQTILFQGDLPNQQVKVTFYGQKVQLEDTWTINWTLPKQ